jgi:hypothetical protein
MQVYRGRRCTAPLITRHGAFTRGKEPLCPLNGRPSEPQSWSGRSEDDEISSAPPPHRVPNPGLSRPPSSRYTDCVLPGHPRQVSVLLGVTIRPHAGWPVNESVPQGSDLTGALTFVSSPKLSYTKSPICT